MKRKTTASKKKRRKLCFIITNVISNLLDTPFNFSGEETEAKVCVQNCAGSVRDRREETQACC